jgi:hypothetical protein
MADTVLRVASSSTLRLVLAQLVAICKSHTLLRHELSPRRQTVGAMVGWLASVITPMLRRGSEVIRKPADRAELEWLLSTITTVSRKWLPALNATVHAEDTADAARAEMSNSAYNECMRDIFGLWGTLLTRLADDERFLCQASEGTMNLAAVRETRQHCPLHPRPHTRHHAHPGPTTGPTTGRTALPSAQPPPPPSPPTASHSTVTPSCTHAARSSRTGLVSPGCNRATDRAS